MWRFSLRGPCTLPALALHSRCALKIISSGRGCNGDGKVQQVPSDHRTNYWTNTSVGPGSTSRTFHARISGRAAGAEIRMAKRRDCRSWRHDIYEERGRLDVEQRIANHELRVAAKRNGRTENEISLEEASALKT